MTDQSATVWRVIDVLKWMTPYFESKKIPHPQVESEWILQDVLRCKRLDIYLNHDRPLQRSELNRIRQLLRARLTGQPIQYVLGYTEFMGLRFDLSPDVLIPRMDTEIIVENVLHWARQQTGDRLSILDLGTGSGNIAVSLAWHLHRSRVVALDISQSALEIARHNASLHGVADRVHFICADMLKPCLPLKPSFQIIISNPPYIGGDHWQQLDPAVKNYEPQLALYPGPEELLFYHCIAVHANRLLAPRGILALEIGGDYQIAALQNLFSAHFSRQRILYDYSGLQRGLLMERAQL